MIFLLPPSSKVEEGQDPLADSKRFQCLYLLIGQFPLGHFDLGKVQGPEEAALGITLERFGPLTAKFLEHIDDEEWETALKGINENVVESPEFRFDYWTHDDGFPYLLPALKEMLSKMLKLTPAERPTIAQVMQDPAWDNWAL